MFLLVSKVLGVLLTVSNGLVILAVGGGLARYAGWRRFGAAMTWVALVGFVLIGFGPISSILIRPLEDRFARPPDTLPEPTGIIVLGGIITTPSLTRGVIALTQDGERLVEAATLAHRYPNARLVFSGGTLGNSDEASSESAFAKRLLVGLGVHESRIILEPRSLSTAENAVFTRDLLMPQPGQSWLLVTSASHLPRAMGSFRRAGFPVTPYPVGYTTLGLSDDYWGIRLEVSSNLVRADIAVHEWLGLLAYWLTGRTDALLPGPDGAQQH